MSRQDNAKTLVDLFQHTVSRHPDRTAVTDRGSSHSYRELQARAASLAARLVESGVRVEDRIALHVDRGIDTFVGIIGILMAGGAYVAVDPGYPAARRDLMFAASGARFSVTGSGAADDTDRLAVTALRPGPAATSRTSAGPADAACVLFTSGSTGTPKPVVLEHRNLVHFATNRSLPAIRPEDRVAHVSSVSFDAFHFETWCGFAAGAEIVVLGTVPELLSGDLQRDLRRHRVSVMLMPSMALNHIVREDRDAFATLRLLCTGGDVVLPETCAQLLESDFSGRLVNLYGPTEATTACVGHEVTDAPGDESVPIGAPFADTGAHVLDADLAEVPVGAVGQLHVSGPGVARGYQGLPELTAERFVTRPADPAARLYATGDLVRVRPDGLLEFVGRADDQVKIRGYRVEPGEVERVLMRHENVRDVVVLGRGRGQDRHLTALVLPHGRPSLRALREYAGEHLPDFMVPASFVAIDDVPVDAHGKRDLAALHALTDEHARGRGPRVAPRDAAERFLVGLWDELLAADQISVTDDFFALGGNSLLAFRAQRRIERELGVHVDQREILTHSELAALAGLIRQRRTAA